MGFVSGKDPAASPLLSLEPTVRSSRLGTYRPKVGFTPTYAPSGLVITSADDRLPVGDTKVTWATFEAAASSWQPAVSGQTAAIFPLTTSARVPGSGDGSTTLAAAETMSRQSARLLEKGPQSMAMVTAGGALAPEADGTGVIAGAAQDPITRTSDASQASLTVTTRYATPLTQDAALKPSQWPCVIASRSCPVA